MVELAEIFRVAGPAYRQAFEGRMLPSHLRAMEDIVSCRTPVMGGSVYQCDDCSALDYSYHSCRNRHCPKCQDDRAQTWLEGIRTRLLPCDHYLVTFTLPPQLRPLARSHQRVVYDILLREAAATLQSVADDPAWVGGRLAILAVLHTWTRALEYHPHAHLLVSAGGLSPDATAWVKPAYPRFLAPGYVLSPIIRAKLRDALRHAELLDQVDPQVWTIDWCVQVQRVGNGQQAALYLSRYVYSVTLTNQRIERFENGRVTFRYRQARTGKTLRRTLPVQQFIALFLQHVLPRGFTKIRYYGLLSSSAKPDLERARTLLDSATQPSRRSTSAVPAATDSATRQEDSSAAADPRKTPRLCPACRQGHLVLKETFPRSRAPP